MDVELAEDLSRIEEVGVVNDPQLLLVFRLEFQDWVTYFLTFQPRRGKLRIRGTQYPLIRKRKVKKPCTAASGIM